MPKFEVCPVCEGEGYVGTLGAYTSEEFHESFEDVDEYYELHEASKVRCDCCKAQRVVTAERLTEWEQECEDAAERAAESRYCGYY